jgi:FtsP/CotA-like multicopper oxidase with cupredoxin domain
VTSIGGRQFRGANRDVVLVDPGECATTEICFQAENKGVWPMHCHMSYHLAAGMLTSVEYEGSSYYADTASDPAVQAQQ